MPKLVSVIIPNWNKSDLLALCLGSLKKQEYAPAEVIVVDNGSTDGSAGMVRASYPEVKLVEFGKNTGFSMAVNAGIEASTGEMVALLNNDAEADPRWLSELVRASGDYPEAGFFASKILFYADRKTIDSFGDGFTAAGFGYKRGWGESADAYGEEGYVLGACGGAAMYRREMLDDIKVCGEYFDPDFFAFGEDLDVSLRAALYGHTCVAVPASVVYHRLRSTGGRGADLPAYLGHRNFMMAVMKDFPGPVIMRNILSIAAYPLLAGIADLVKNRRLSYFRGYVDAFRMWGKMRPKRAAIQAASRVSPAEFEAALTRGWLSLWMRLGRMSRDIKGRGL